MREMGGIIETLSLWDHWLVILVYILGIIEIQMNKHTCNNKKRKPKGNQLSETVRKIITANV